VTSGADRTTLLTELSSFPERLSAAAREAATSGRATPEGEWTASEIIRHLIAVETEIWHGRLEALVAAGSGIPRWPWIEPGFDDGPADRPLEDLLATFASLRAETFARFEALDDAGWARVGLHEVYGQLDVFGLARLAINHDEEHLVAIRRS
jgi:hypothetical protein